MEFKSDRPIYIQIVDLCLARILSGEWQPGGRVPSVRELAVQLAVNSHTVLKSFEALESDGIIYSRRGLGFFLADDARERALKALRAEFFEITLRDLFKSMEMLGVSIDDVVARYSTLK